jgi:hypothetical protein
MAAGRGRKQKTQPAQKSDRPDFFAFMRSELPADGPPPRKAKKEESEVSSRTDDTSTASHATPAPDIYEVFGRAWAERSVVQQPKREKSLLEEMGMDEVDDAASEDVRSAVAEVEPAPAASPIVEVKAPEAAPAPVAAPAAKEAPKPVASPAAAPAPAAQPAKRPFANPMVASPASVAPAQAAKTKSTNPFDTDEPNPFAGSFMSLPSHAQTSAPAPAAHPSNEAEREAAIASLLSTTVEAPVLGDQALEAELNALDDTRREVKLVASPARSTNDTLVSDLVELKELIAAHKNVISTDFLKAAKQVHDGVNQVLVQRGVAIMTDADEKAEFKQEEKDYFKARAKKHHSTKDRIAYRGFSITNAVGETKHEAGIKDVYEESCQDKRRLALKDDFMASQEYKDLRTTVQKTTELVKSFAHGFSQVKKKEIGEDKSRYNGVAQGLNDQLNELKPFSATISGRYSKPKTAIGWAMIVGGLVALVATGLAVLASFGLLSLPGLATGYLGANLVTGGVALVGAAGFGLFGGGVTLTVKGAQKGAAKAVTNLVDVTAREAQKLLPYQARQLLKP